MFLNKQGKGDTWIIVLIAVLILYMGYTSNFLGLGAVTGGVSEVTDVSDVLAQACDDPSNTFTFGPLYTKWGSQITSGENIHWWKNGISQGTNAVDSTVTLRNGDKLAFMPGVDSSTYYANYFEEEMPCGPTDLASLSVEAGDGAHELCTADVDFTINAFSSDNGLLNGIASGNNETIGAGEQGSFDLKIEGTSEQGISPHGDLLLIVGIEKNNFTKGDTTLNGNTATGTLPSWFSTNNLFNYEVFTIPGGPTSGKIFSWEGKLTVQAKDSVNPGPTAGELRGEFLNLTVVNSDYDIDTNSNQIMGGGKPVFEDNAGTQSGFANDGLTLAVQ